LNFQEKESMEEKQQEDSFIDTMVNWRRETLQHRQLRVIIIGSLYLLKRRA
jgi:hypothetical protein